jgi:hypothetical protein
MYQLVYQLYNCDGVGVHKNKYQHLFWDNFRNKLNIKYSYSFKFQSIKNIKINNFPCQLDNELFNYYTNNSLYMCGMDILYPNELINDDISSYTIDTELNVFINDDDDNSVTII